MMKCLVSALLALMGCLFSLSAQAFVCWGKDIGCLAWAILPFSQTNTSIHEWAPISGKVTGSGNKVLFTFRFNQTAINTFQYNHAWWAPSGIVYKKFGLEIDICDPSKTLKFDTKRIGHNFPWNAYASRDIDTSNWVNDCTNAIGLLVQDASVLQPNVDYKVLFFLKDPLPANGVEVKPSFQIVADTTMVKPGQVVTAKVQVKAKDGNTNTHMRPGKDRIEVDIYMRQGTGDWTFLKREYIQATNLPSGGTHTESVSYTIPSSASSVSFKAKIDAEDEAYESNEGDNWSRIETFRVFNPALYQMFLQLLLD